MLNPYRKAQEAAASADPRAVERDLLLRITRSMEAAAESGDRMALIRAVTDNHTLWNVFVTEVLSKGNRLPPELRSAIASVGTAVIREMTRDTTDFDVPFLVDINRNIIAGLSERPMVTAPAPAAARTPASGVSA